jgi:hypothetical protein
MTAQEFVQAYMALLDIYAGFTTDERETVTTEFVQYRATVEQWRKVVEP